MIISVSSARTGVGPALSIGFEGGGDSDGEASLVGFFVGRGLFGGGGGVAGGSFLRFVDNPSFFESSFQFSEGIPTVLMVVMGYRWRCRG